MSKPRKPYSPAEAFNRSVVALKLDREGRDGYERAALIVGKLTKSHLEKCGVSDGRPVSMEVASAIDIALCQEGGEPVNELSMQARRITALEGSLAPEPDPAFLMKRALRDLDEARKLLEWGKGSLSECEDIWRKIYKLQNNLLDAIADRERPSSQDDTSRSGADDDRLRLVTREREG